MKQPRYPTAGRSFLATRQHGFQVLAGFLEMLLHRRLRQIGTFRNRQMKPDIGLAKARKVVEMPLHFL